MTMMQRRKEMILMIRTVMYGIGRPCTAQEIKEKTDLRRHGPTMNQLSNILTKYPDFKIVHSRARIGRIAGRRITGTYSTNLYDLTSTEGLVKPLYCNFCHTEIITDREGAKTKKGIECKSCYRKRKRWERRNPEPEPKEIKRKVKLCIMCNDEITNNNTKYCSVVCRKIGQKKRGKNA
tara:strand:+ start:2596 stop:3132 length:537 start_codon:yes stop_codon:yes gene_type:complete